MEGSERDSTQDWLLPEGSAPPLLSELEGRIDEALTIARASEKVAIAVGDAALDAAQQARRAADIAERATAAVLDVVPAPPADSPPPAGSAEPPSRTPDPQADAPVRLADTSLFSFNERADRVAQRLRELERV
jgi:hypothetical protein